MFVSIHELLLFFHPQPDQRAHSVADEAHPGNDSGGLQAVRLNEIEHVNGEPYEAHEHNQDKMPWILFSVLIGSFLLFMFSQIVQIEFL